jgi:hypothetical protein
MQGPPAPLVTIACVCIRLQPATLTARQGLYEWRVSSRWLLTIRLAEHVGHTVTVKGVVSNFLQSPNRLLQSHDLLLVRFSLLAAFLLTLGFVFLPHFGDFAGAS